MKRAIVLFPKFSNIEAIQAVRERFDPLANYIAPHITLVFPFESTLSTVELKAHLRHTLAGMKQFAVSLSGVTGDFRDGYLFLNVKQGNDNIIDLHDRLYSGALEPFLFRKVTYCPHITVGRVEEPSAFDLALEELADFQERFVAEIDKVYVENIDSGDRSSIELIFDLE
ncbi:MAG: 2'-5' RNA ligase [Firmicutes bacterium HGW-Firmicutes-9]|jgi:2'-5' RNA ligase|nr:MAG: 2'-5' RNA ligase [Firmicutes bacterium HGW-Firmicutes-9]